MEDKRKFNLLSLTKKLIFYVNNLLPNYPKKEMVLKQNIEKTQYELLENIFAFTINTSGRIKDKNMKDFLIKLSMYDLYINVSYHKKYISSHQLKCIMRLLVEIRKIAYGIIRNINNDLSKNS